MIKTVINEHPNSRESATLARNSSTNIHVSEFAWFMIIKNRAFNQLKSIKKKILEGNRHTLRYFGVVI